MDYKVKELGKFQYIEEGQGETLLLLHGLFGALSNFGTIIEHFRKDYRILVPVLPIYEAPLRELSVGYLKNYVVEFLEAKGETEKMHVLGNSLGGHVSLFMALEEQDRLKSLILTGSSGLFENTLGNTFPKRKSYTFIERKAEYTFYDPATASKELVDSLFEIVNNNEKAIRVVACARSAIRDNVENRLHNIKVPTLLIWGKQDRITPPFVGEDFHKGIEKSQLYYIDKCGHAPMMERPDEFNRILSAFLAHQN
ncbi:alpha/beta fold hydrolase [Saprospira grandis]|uniref:Alpha/beta hydrolase fold protein n=1 Tax=Saprospira grandis (strain Lewin) TaxID=984262 RepID=H6LA18_SAPGL|nr:alpha/beta hydrolase [Saprospira grandis]AFC25486.1 alpha/beta hydrolase fold protein [Saprospira grandis str. Lewin]WBM73525.1 alpha/beta hydrolase [Saprospira grandis]